MKDRLRLKTYSAVGLVEVLIVLAIIGVTMVSAMALTTDSFRTVRDNEVTDLASGFLLQGLEIAKSPQRVVLTDGFGAVVAVQGSYKIDQTQEPPVLFKVNDVTDSLIQTCDQRFQVVITQEVTGQTPKVCLQVVIEEIPALGYKITAHVHYTTREGAVVRTLYGFRAEKFVI